MQFTILAIGYSKAIEVQVAADSVVLSIGLVGGGGGRGSADRGRRKEGKGGGLTSP